jgi:hypothetical protein
MIRRRKIILLLLIGYALGLVWGQVRLPVAAVKSLDDYSLLRGETVVSASDEQLQMSAMQKWYLKRFLHVADGANPPQISATVKWNWGIVARVRSGHYISPTGAEWLDGLYVCLFGSWLRVYSFSHAMA